MVKCSWYKIGVIGFPFFKFYVHRRFHKVFTFPFLHMPKFLFAFTFVVVHDSEHVFVSLFGAYTREPNWCLLFISSLICCPLLGHL